MQQLNRAPFSLWHRSHNFLSMSIPLALPFSLPLSVEPGIFSSPPQYLVYHLAKRVSPLYCMPIHSGPQRKKKKLYFLKSRYIHFAEFILLVFFGHLFLRFCRTNSLTLFAFASLITPFLLAACCFSDHE